MEKGKYTTFWYLLMLCYLTQRQFTIGLTSSFFVFSGTTAEFKRPERSVSFVPVRPRVKSANHQSTVISNGEDSK